MSQVRAMVSSTCFDLAPVREAIGKCLESLGFLVLMSERASFPSLPHLSTVENCRRAAREETDLLVLIVGGRRGTIAPGTDSTITNLEYREARAANVPILVFVQRRIWEALPIWLKNPEIDLSSHVDSNDVFAFIQELQRDNRWIVPFSQSADIEDGIRHQSSQLFKYLLDLRRGLESGPNAAFANESARVRDLLISQPENWEHKLFAELLMDRIRPLRARLTAIRDGSVFLPSSDFVSLHTFKEWAERQVHDFEAIIKVIKRQFEVDWLKAMGPAGVQADLPGLQDCANRITECCQAALRLEERNRSAHADHAVQRLLTISNVWGGDIFLEVFHFVEAHLAFVNTPNLSGAHEVAFKLNAPKGVDEYTSLLNDLF